MKAVTARKRHRSGAVLLITLFLLSCTFFTLTAFERRAIDKIQVYRTPVVHYSSPRNMRPAFATNVYRPIGDDVDCSVVLGALRRLYEASKLRQSAWHAAGHDLTVEDPRGLNVTEIHILMIGDSWARRHGAGLMRMIDGCRLLLPEPLIERDECALHFTHSKEPFGHIMYQLSKAALGLESTGFLRVHLQYHRQRYRAGAAADLKDTLQSRWPTPSTTTLSVPHQAQCRRHLGDVIRDMEEQMPVCLCQDTLDVDRHRLRRVPVDAVQLFTGMWHVSRPTLENDLFAFTDKTLDWYARVASLSPNRTKFPSPTWEENVERTHRFHENTYVRVIRRAVANAKAFKAANASMPPVILSRTPKMNCTGNGWRKFVIRSHDRCWAMTPALHDSDDELVRAAYGEASRRFPSVAAPEWLRLVNYRPLSATEWPEHERTYDGQQLASGDYLCLMPDGVHLHTSIDEKKVPPHVLWCTRHAYHIFWEQMR